MKYFFASILLTLFLIPVNGQEHDTFKGNHPGVHKIVVKEVIQTNNYTYVNAEENGETYWLAVPKLDAKEGETYYFQGGMQMGEFTSRELDRTFDSILFLNGLISPDVVEGGEKPALNMSPQKAKRELVQENVKIEPAGGSITIEELLSNREKYKGQVVKVRGKVTKFNGRIMSRNWIHLQDGTGSNGKFDITATSEEMVQVGDIITVEGIITLEKDFGAGYFYDIIMEDSRIVEREE